MHHPTLPAETDTKVVVHGIRLELTDELRNAATEKASRLLAAQPRIHRIMVQLEHNADADVDSVFIAKGQVEFGGPALFTSVMAADPWHALDYLIDKLDHQLRRQRFSRTSDTVKRRPPSSHSVESQPGL
jgi:ribosome hibernation promoting factor